MYSGGDLLRRVSTEPVTDWNTMVMLWRRRVCGDSQPTNRWMSAVSHQKGPLSPNVCKRPRPLIVLQGSSLMCERHMHSVVFP